MLTTSVSNNSTIDITSLAIGTYTISIKTINSVINKKLVIVR